LLQVAVTDTLKVKAKALQRAIYSL
jgi:hypothetical protein